MIKLIKRYYSKDGESFQRTVTWFVGAFVSLFFCGIGAWLLITNDVTFTRAEGSLFCFVIGLFILSILVNSLRKES